MIDPYIAEWLGLVGRWFHLTIGIAWIGASFYFVWLNNAVRPVKTESSAVAGEVWSVHGGAFYRVVKYSGVPEQMPHELHWFKWEAYLTWLSGFYLLLLVYWFDAARTMVVSGSGLAPAVSVCIGAGVLTGGYLLYDIACRTLAGRPVLLASLLTGFVTVTTYGLFQVLSPKAAYVHVGAMLGTWMAANVLFVIIPGQRAIVDAMVAGDPPPLERGKAGALRSLHNNYITLPVLFVMVSGHFPSTWGHPQGWLVLLGVAAAGLAVRHALNVGERGQPMPWLWAVATVTLLAAAAFARPVRATANGGAPAVSIGEVQVIVANRCLACHATTPFKYGYTAPPLGFVLDRPELIEANKHKIRAQVVDSKVMPLGNVTQMTDEERATIAAWAAQ